MGFLGVSCTSVSVTLETCQPYIVACVSLGVIQSVDTKLMCIFGLVGPEVFYVANCTAIILGLPDMQDVVDLEVKPLKSLGLVLTLVSNKLLCDSLT